jgi:hypothetical protein
MPNSNTIPTTNNDVQVVPNQENEVQKDIKMDTTTFVNDAIVKVNNTAHVYHLPDGFLKTSYGGIIDQSLKAFLEKPIVFASGSFQTTDSFATFFNNWAMPYSLLTGSSANIWLSKLKGFYGIRMTLKFTITVNADPFQQGRYILAWVPLAGAANDTTKYGLTLNQSLCSLVQRTTVPHVEIDLNNDTVAELTIPFVSVRNYWNLAEAFSSNRLTDLGILALYPYEPLVSPAGSTIASFTIYASMTDVELYGAASPESGLDESSELSNTLNNANTFLKDTKILSRGSSALGQVAKYAGDFVSLFAPAAITAPLYTASWIMNSASNIAKLHGYSKPTQGDAALKVTVRTNPNHSTVDGDCDAAPLGMMASTGVASMPGLAGTKYDEMSYVSIATRPAWFKTETWSTTDGVGAFSSTNINHYYGISQSGNDMCQPISLLSLMHSYVRGGIRIRVKFVKTKFHSGRISFSFFPTGSIDLTGNDAYVNRWIIDLRTQNEVVMDIPFISDRQWILAGEKFGVLKASIVSKLVAPANVSGSIKLLYEVSALEDIEYALPGPLNQSLIVATPQSGLYDEGKSVDGELGAGNLVKDPILSTASTVGEKIVSVRTYLRRFFPFRGMVGDATSLSKFNLHYNSIVTDTIPALPTPTTDTFPTDPWGILARCYAISRGGMRYRFMNGAGNTVPTTVSLTVNYPTTDATTTVSSVDGLTGIYTGYSRVYQQCTNNSTVTVEVPQYTTVFGRATADLWTTGAATCKYKVNGRGCSTIVHALPLSVTCPANQAGFENTSVFRAMADDGDLMCFVSVPPIRDVTTLRIGSWAGALS